MSFNYDLFEKCVKSILDDRFYDPDFSIGVDLSDTPGVKVIFDGFAETDDGGEDKDSQSYAIFIHKNTGEPEFLFPEHDTAWGMIVHRPTEEVCVYAWYSVKEDFWDIIPPDNFDPAFPEEKFMEVLQKINDLYYSDYEEEDS